MQQRHLKQQNQATLAALQQNALQNQAQLAALQQNVAQLQQLEQQVLAPAYTAGAAQGPSAAAATAQFQQCVQQILQQKQQLQQQIRQFQLQVEQQLAFPQQQMPPLAGSSGSGVASAVTRVERVDGDAVTDGTPKIPIFSNEDNGSILNCSVNKYSLFKRFLLLTPLDEVKSPNRAEKRPIDSTSSDDSSSSSSAASSGSGGLQVTGAPVPLFAAQEVSVASANIGIQVQSSTLSNGGSAQCVTGITFQPLSGSSVSLPCPAYSGPNATVKTKHLYA